MPEDREEVSVADWLTEKSKKFEAHVEKIDTYLKQLNGVTPENVLIMRELLESNSILFALLAQHPSIKFIKE